MMAVDVHIETLERRYRLATGDQAAARRLDGEIDRALEVEVPRALERAGVAPEEQLCVREVFVPIRRGRDESEREFSAEWARAFAAAVVRATEAGDRGRVLRFASRERAFQSFARAAVRGDGVDAWAWAQLGFLARGERLTRENRAELLARELSREPRRIVTTLAELARVDFLGALAPGWNVSVWRALAERAWSCAGGASLVGTLPREAPRIAPGGSSSRTAALAGRATTSAFRVAARSTILQSLRRVADAPQRGTLEAWAILAVLEVEPALAGRDVAWLPWLVRAVAETIVDSTGVGAVDRAGDHPLAARSSRPGADEECELPAAARSADRRGSRDAAPAAAGKDVTRPEAGPRPAPGEESVADDLLPRGVTAHGGLLFLVSLLEPTGLHERAGSTVFAERSTAWVLHALAIQLTGADPDDCAALVFAGRPPGAEPPSRDVPRANPAERAALREWSRAIVAALRERVGEVADARLPAPAREGRDPLLDFVVARRALVTAEPGWVELRFALSDVSTELRRAGLDLDPGFVPWLGFVVKFRYD